MKPKNRLDGAIFSARWAWAPASRLRRRGRSLKKPQPTASPMMRSARRATKADLPEVQDFYRVNRYPAKSS